MRACLSRQLSLRNFGVDTAPWVPKVPTFQSGLILTPSPISPPVFPSQERQPRPLPCQARNEKIILDCAFPFLPHPINMLRVFAFSCSPFFLFWTISNRQKDEMGSKTIPYSVEPFVESHHDSHFIPHLLFFPTSSRNIRIFFIIIVTCYSPFHPPGSHRCAVRVCVWGFHVNIQDLKVDCG